MTKLANVKFRHGAYYLVRRRTGPDGKKHEKWKWLGKSKSEARLARDQLLGYVFGPNESPSLESFARRWLAEYVATERSEKNRRLAEQRMRDHVLPVVGTYSMAELEKDPSLLRPLKHALLHAKKANGDALSVQTVRHILLDVGCLFRFAVDEARVIDRSPFSKKLLPRVQGQIPDPLSEVEVMRLFDVVPEANRLLCLVALACGARYGEHRPLDWESHVELGARPLLRVERSHQLEHTKTKSWRVVPIPRPVAERLALEPRRSQYVFTGRSGGMIAEGSNWIDRALKLVGPTVHFHRLRHTFACRLLAAEVPISVVQKLLGHASVTTTERYARLFDRDVIRVYSQLPADWLWGTKEGQRGDAVQLAVASA